jgi:hypothetical protein
MITPISLINIAHKLLPLGKWTLRQPTTSNKFVAVCWPYSVTMIGDDVSYRYSRHGRTVESADLAEFLAMVEHAKSLHQQAVRVRQEMAKPAPSADRNAHFRDGRSVRDGIQAGYDGEVFAFFRMDATNHPLAPVGNILVSLSELTDDHARNLLACVGRDECTRIRAYYWREVDDLFALIERVHGS